MQATPHPEHVDPEFKDGPSMPKPKGSDCKCGTGHCCNTGTPGDHHRHSMNFEADEKATGRKEKGGPRTRGVPTQGEKPNGGAPTKRGTDPEGMIPDDDDDDDEGETSGVRARAYALGK